MAPGPRFPCCFHARTTPSTQIESPIASCWQSPLVFERAAHTERSGKPLLRCMSLTDNVPFMTAIANDLGYEEVFARQLANVLQRGDVVVLISGSGNSPNVVKAAKFAKRRGAVTIGMTGFGGGKLRRLVDVCLHVDSDQYGVIEDLHMAVGSILAFYFKQRR